MTDRPTGKHGIVDKIKEKIQRLIRDLEVACVCDDWWEPTKLMDFSEFNHLKQLDDSQVKYAVEWFEPPIFFLGCCLSILQESNAFLSYLSEKHSYNDAEGGFWDDAEILIFWVAMSSQSAYPDIYIFFSLGRSGRAILKKWSPAKGREPVIGDWMLYLFVFGTQCGTVTRCIFKIIIRSLAAYFFNGNAFATYDQHARVHSAVCRTKIEKIEEQELHCIVKAQPEIQEWHSI